MKGMESWRTPSSAIDGRARRAALLGVGVLLACLTASACIAAPIVQAAHGPARGLANFAGAAEAVEVSLPDGERLRGVFLHADDGAPVILHLLPSAASITVHAGFAGLPETLLALRDQGYASLVLDYRGVGTSSGEPDARSLIADARAMWTEALRRAGGAPERVLIRATSIGCIAAAGLLEDGAEPGALLLFAPVRAETVGAHAARERHGALLGGLLASLLCRPVEADLVGALARSRMPLLLVLPERDVYLSGDEQRELVHARKSVLVRRLRSHHALALRTLGFALDEESLGGRLEAELLEEERAFLSALRVAL